MDLKNLNLTETSSEGSWLQLVHPTKFEPLFADEEKTRPMRIKLLGADSEEYRIAKHTLANKRLKRVAKAGGNAAAVVSSESIESDATYMLVACTLEFENIVFDGEEIPFSKMRARALYDDLQWLREQVDEFVGDRGNHLGDS